MQSLQKQWTAKGVCWFTVISSAQATQGYVDAGQENPTMQKMGAQPTAAILDPQRAISGICTEPGPLLSMYQSSHRD